MTSLTETEAKTKWCPFTRVAGVVSRETGACASVNRENEEVYGASGTECIGPACMAWRWGEAKRTAAFLEAVQAHMKTQPKPNFNTAVQAVYADADSEFARTEGYCGLAGQS